MCQMFFDCANGLCKGIFDKFVEKMLLKKMGILQGCVAPEVKSRLYENT